MPQIPVELEDFLDAYTWEDSKRVLLQHPELMDEEVDFILDQMSEFYQFSISKKGRTVDMIREHQKLLQSCRNKGVPTAFADKHGTKAQPLETLVRTFFYAESLDEIASLVAHYPELLDEEVEDMIASVVGYSLTPAGNRMTEERRILLRLCREIGIDEAFKSYQDIRALQATIIDFLNTNELNESKQFVLMHPELLTSEAMIVLDRFIETLTEQPLIAIATDLRNLLENCSSEGVSVAYARKKAALIEQQLSEDI